MRNKIFGIFGCILFHLLIILPFVVTIVETKEKVKKIQPHKEIEIDVKLIPTKPKINENQNKIDLALKLSYPADPEFCTEKDKTYLGIGLLKSFGSDLIIYIPKPFPAYKAGLRLGDFILNPDAEIIDGYLDYDIMRYDKKMHFHIKVDNICFNKR